MSIITVRNLDPAAKRRIERRAAAHGRSMEAEIRDILESVPEPEPTTGFAAAMARVDLIMRDIDVEVEFPAREVEYQREVELDVIVLDTNVVSALLTRARHPALLPVRNWATRQGPGELYVTAITRAEVAVGVAKLEDGRRKTALSQAAAAYFEAMEPYTLDFTAADAERYADVTIARQRAGRPISILDAQIAAIALHAKASLATRNTKDFEGIGLRLIDPYQN